MRLKYAGHKPIISCKGVDFSLGKEDKYAYIGAATQMLNFLSGVDTNTEIHINPKRKFDEKEVFATLYKHRTNFNSSYQNLISEYEKKLQNQFLHIDVVQNLTEIEREVFKKNLKYIKEYRLQRATNKIVYEELIQGCIGIIQDKGVRELTMPLSPCFVHVAESFAKSLLLTKHPNLSKVEVKVDKNQPYKNLSVTLRISSVP